MKSLLLVSVSMTLVLSGCGSSGGGGSSAPAKPTSKPVNPTEQSSFVSDQNTQPKDSANKTPQKTPTDQVKKPTDVIAGTPAKADGPSDKFEVNPPKKEVKPAVVASNKKVSVQTPTAKNAVATTASNIRPVSQVSVQAQSAPAPQGEVFHNVRILSTAEVLALANNPAPRPVLVQPAPAPAVAPEPKLVTVAQVTPQSNPLSEQKIVQVSQPISEANSQNPVAQVHVGVFSGAADMTSVSKTPVVVPEPVLPGDDVLISNLKPKDLKFVVLDINAIDQLIGDKTLRIQNGKVESLEGGHLNKKDTVCGIARLRDAKVVKHHNKMKFSMIDGERREVDNTIAQLFYFDKADFGMTCSKKSEFTVGDVRSALKDIMSVKTKAR